MKHIKDIWTAIVIGELQSSDAFYVVDRTCFSKDQQMIWPDTQLFEMVEENSVDIDTPLDFEIANMIMIERQKHKC